ncbi:MAG: hypothetical protein IKO93_22395, partial [Lentisphaeria bacterium]|nr:hypothetical protein [Lentisphaeria bacterium]
MIRKTILAAVLLTGLFSGCIRIEPRNQEPVQADMPVLMPEKALIPASKRDRQLHGMIMDRIE